MKSVKWRDRTKLPKEPGVYYAYANRKLLYVGTSRNMNERWTDNFGHGEHHQSQQLAKMKCTHLCYRIIQSHKIRHHVEAVEIRKNKPPLNNRMETPDKWLLLGGRLVEIVATSAAACIVWSLIVSYGDRPLPPINITKELINDTARNQYTGNDRNQ